MPELKSAVRKAGLQSRDGLTAEYRARASMAIAEALGRHLQPGRCAIAGGYLPIRSEVDPRPAMRLLAGAGAQIAVPAIVEGDLEFRELAPDVALEAQGFGTHAPGSAAVKLDPVLLLVPLAAFDAGCGRVGYGKGFYDRAIARLSGPGGLLTVGLAFDAQRVDHVPMEAHDRALDLIVTESAIHRRSPAPAR